MPLRLVQLDDAAGDRLLAAMTDDGRARRVNGHDTTYDLARAAIAAGSSLGEAVEAAGLGEAVDVRDALAEGRVRAPIDHPDPAHLLVTGTGLTHLGSAEGRDKMHRDLKDAATLTDSMKMFRLGLEGGKPEPGQIGVQPEWFYKGTAASSPRPARPDLPILRPGRRRGAGAGRHLCHRPGRNALPARLRPGQ
ncbi:hypothetical protein [Brevundimonas denitrificans]|uniref:hypothetical protein n=1 Tax=Brevundimonas denitrificans TaxID=1443434 RepID=UPI00352FB02B